MNKIIAFMLIFFFISGLSVTVFSAVYASSLVEDTWHTKTPMSQARDSLSVVAVDGKIYAIGGQTNDGYVGTDCTSETGIL
jgi:N-acetylneuraminic acid mutarotase